MGRVGTYAGAGAAFAVAVALTLARVGERPGAFPNWQALVLGVVQGLTELLPVSSSGHLILVPWLGDWNYLERRDDLNQTFVYFRREVARLLSAWLRSLRRRRIEGADERIAWLVLVATVPAAVVGALGEDVIAEHLGEPWQIAILLAFFGVVLWVADRSATRRKLHDLGLRTAVVVGFAEALALAPGVSRAGITISAARLLALDRDAAARFSFLLLIPIVFGAVVLKGMGDVVVGDLPPGTAGPFVVGTIASAVSGLVAIRVLLGYVRRHDYSVFVAYRLIAAAVVLLLIATGARAPTF
jgi:undecaprenyl-diphosphatase